MRIPNDGRSSTIKELYRSVLKREADLPGLEAYYKSGLSEKEIEEDLRGSEEYQILNNIKPQPRIPTLMDNFMIGQSPKSDEDLQVLLSGGVKVVVSIGRSPFITYNQEVFEEHFIIPIGDYGSRDLDPRAVNKCITTLYKKVCEEGKKVYLHSVDGLTDVVLVAAMLRFVVKGGSFTSSLYHILAGGFPVSLSQDCVSAELVKQAIEMRSKVVGKDLLGSAPVYMGTPGPILDPCH